MQSENQIYAKKNFESNSVKLARIFLTLQQVFIKTKNEQKIK